MQGAGVIPQKKKRIIFCNVRSYFYFSAGTDYADENCMDRGKMVKRTVLGSFLIGLAVVMLGCPTSATDPDDKQDSRGETYSVTYNGNGNDAGDVPSDSNEYEEDAEVVVLGNTGGSVPVDSSPYREGDTVTVLGNSGDLVKTDTFFCRMEPFRRRI